MADLDRLITLQVRAAGMRVEGVLQPGAVTFEGSVWARYLRADQGLDFSLGAGGLVIEQDRRFRIRWRLDVAEATTDRLAVTDDLAIAYNVSRVSTPDTRRRHVELHCVRTSP